MSSTPIFRIKLLSLTLVAVLFSCACNGSKQSSKPDLDDSSKQSSKPDLDNTTSQSSHSTTLGESGPSTREGCMPTGCSGQVCAPVGETVMTTCQWREEYACYKTARCEKQPNGKCGWTPTETLSSCLKARAVR